MTRNQESNERGETMTLVKMLAPIIFTFMLSSLAIKDFKKKAWAFLLIDYTFILIILFFVVFYITKV